MPKSLRVVAALLFVTAQLFIPAAMAGEVASSSAPAAQIVAFDRLHERGAQPHLQGGQQHRHDGG